MPASFVEIGHSIAAPYAGMVLGELGAEVIKVSPAIGDSIPSVAMDDGTLSPVVIRPIANPINAHAASAHNCRDHGQPPMRMPHDERRQCKDLTHRQIDPDPEAQGTKANLPEIDRIATATYPQPGSYGVAVQLTATCVDVHCSNPGVANGSVLVNVQ